MSSYHIKNLEEYYKVYRKSIREPELFWEEIAEEHFNWHKKWDKVLSWDFKKPEVKWFDGAKLNITENCIDRHLRTRGNKTAIIFEPNNPDEKVLHITYKQLHKRVNRLANVLTNKGIKKGDRVCIYLPMIPELAVSVLACARIGAIHSVVFAGFSATALATRINDSGCKMVLTSDGSYRGNKTIDLKGIVDEALTKCPEVNSVLVVKRIHSEITMLAGRDNWLQPLLNEASATYEPEIMNAEDPLFILYTSGSTGNPKGMVHTTAGYMVYTAYTFKNVFNYKEEDIYWCTADIGWITGHSYIIYGPLANGATTVMFEGVPSYPDYGRFWEIVEKHKISQFYTAPTAIRALMREGDSPVNKTSRKSLKLLGTVGEPINPEAWMWYYKTVGNSKCPIVDTWWQTETGGIMISPQTGAIPLKPGSATKPFYGIKPVLVDKSGKEIKGAGEGRLCIAQSWPGQMRTVYGDHQRFIDTYFSQFDGKYFTGDGCKRDKDGYYWITGRVDDVIIVSGHNLGTAEIESAFVAHPKVAEAAVVGYPHDIKGNGLYCYVTLNAGERETGELERDLKLWVRKQIGPLATPDLIHFTPGLPKTRSGKIMRRILRKIAHNEHGQLGDTTTLADPGVVQSLVDNRKNI